MKTVSSLIAAVSHAFFGKHGKHLLINFCMAEETVKIKCDVVVKETGIIANFGSFQVWYYYKSITNILSLKLSKHNIRFHVIVRMMEHSMYILTMGS